jgi:hypothetical protein
MNPFAPLLLSLSLLGETNDVPPAPTTPAPPPISAATPFLHELSPGKLEYNGVTLDKKNHRISFAATVNQTVGLVEYLLVNEKGKVHESLFATKVLPHDIHLALLLIGLKDPTANAKAPVPPEAIDSNYLHAAPKLKGPTVRMTVTYMQDGVQKEIPAEDWILNLETNQPMTQGAWTYNGSLVQDGIFLADQELSIVAVITDPTALVNNPRKGYDNDEIWQIKAGIPPIDTPIEIAITIGDSLLAKP